MVGIGPGGPLDRTRRAENAIAQSDLVIGYSRYVDCVKDLTGGKEVVRSAMREEVERCERALDAALSGRAVALVCSGDAGIYGMAGLVLELAAERGVRVPVEIVPGVTAASAAAARLGAPLMLDFACISLSDLLVPWDTIRRRLEAAAAADLVVALYNPKSRQREEGIVEAAEIFRRHRPGTTPVGVATGVRTEDERVEVSDLDRFLDLEISMRSVVIVGNSSSRRLGRWFVTPRGYRLP